MRISTVTLTLALLLASGWFASGAELRPGGTGQVPGHYIVVLNTRAPATVAHEHGVAANHIYRHSIQGFSAALSDNALQQLLADRRVAYIEPDSRVFIAAPGGNSNKGGKTVTQPVPQTTPWGVTRVGGPQSGIGLTAWVIDTGIDLNHEDLNVDASRGASFVSRGRYSMDDGHGHGTHVAGTIAALDNDIDVVGVAAGAKVVPVRVLDNSGSGFVSWVIAGVDYVAANATSGDVANMSLGGGISTALDDAVIAAASQGVLFAVAAGNDATSALNSSPARAEHNNIFTVSAIDSNDIFASFSNYGNPPIDYAGPGVSVLSTAKGGGVISYSGTSMATPHIAGLLLLRGIALSSDGNAINDRDGVPDPIAHY